MFDPVNETILAYLKRKIAEYPNKRDLVRQCGVSDWTISKIVRDIHVPRLDIVQPLFSFFIIQDEEAKKRSRKKTSTKVETVN